VFENFRSTTEVYEEVSEVQEDYFSIELAMQRESIDNRECLFVSITVGTTQNSYHIIAQKPDAPVTHAKATCHHHGVMMPT